MSITEPARRHLLLAGAGTLLAGLVARPGAATAGPAIYTGALSSLAAGGYDVVAYFTQRRPVVGSSAFTHRWSGATWRFASAAARDAFAAAPERYAPAFGGHCAWAASQGYRASGSPLAWRIVDDRLFLNYDLRVQQLWEADIPALVAAGDRNWPALLGR